MSFRTTQKRLEAIVARINDLTNSPKDTYTKLDNGTYKANIGNYHLDGAYGGWKLVRILGENGGIEDVLRSGYVSKAQLDELMQAFIRGIETGNS